MLGCVSPQIGDLRSAGQGDDMRAKSTDYRLWTALTGSVGAEFPFGSRFFLTASVEGGWAPRAIEVLVNEAGQKKPLGVAETSRFVADLAARLGVTLD
jgi:hypothetical protein